MNKNNKFKYENIKSNENANFEMSYKEIEKLMADLKNCLQQLVAAYRALYEKIEYILSLVFSVLFFGFFPSVAPTTARQKAKFKTQNPSQKRVYLIVKSSKSDKK